MLRIAICDDDKIVVSNIEKILENIEVSTDFEIEYKSFIDVRQLLSDINSGKEFDLILLDIELGDISGIEFAKHLRHELNLYNTKIVFITSKESYMKDVFECDALRFIKKPVEKAPILDAIEYIIKSKIKEKEVLVYKENDETKFIPYNEIMYVTSKRRKMEIVCKYENIECNLQLCNEEAKFISNKFIKISRSVMVNRVYCQKIKGSKIVLNSGECLDISPMMKSRVEDWFKRSKMYDK